MVLCRRLNNFHSKFFCKCPSLRAAQNQKQARLNLLSARFFFIFKQMTEKKIIANPLVSIIMGSTSDWETMKNAAGVLIEFGVPFETKVVSAHRTPDLLFEFAKSAETRGLEVIIAGAGGAAHLPGMCASQTVVPVLGVPVQSKALSGMDSLLSIVQMPAGIPVGTLAIGTAGAKNAALLAVSILANSRPELRERLHEFRRNQTQTVLDSELK